MIAIHVLEKNKYEIAEISKPVCGDHEFLLQVNACAVCGTDVKILKSGHRLARYPVIPGHELIGTIQAIGDALLPSDYPFHIGDRVVLSPGIPCRRCDDCLDGNYAGCKNKRGVGFHMPGGFTEFITLPEAAVCSLIRVPDSVSDEAATLMEPLACCLHGQKKMGEWKRADRVVIIGAGAIGALHAELARLQGAEQIILIDIVDERLELVRQVNPDIRTINSATNASVDAVHAIAGPEGVDKVIVACPAKDVYEDAMKMLKPGGVLLLFSSLPPQADQVGLDVNDAHYRELVIHGTFGSTKSDQREALHLLRGGLLRNEKVITHRYPLTQFSQAITAMERGETLKVVLKP